MTTVDACKRYACKLQTCLQQNTYQPSRCEQVIEELRQCCIKHSDKSVVCSGIDTSKPYEHNTVDYLPKYIRICISHLLMDAVNKAKARFKKYPFLVAQCRESATAYATCVIRLDNVQKHDCETEFKIFKDCLVKAAANNKTKL